LYYKGEESAPDLTTEQCDGMERGQIKGGKWTETPSFKELISIATNGKIWS